MVPLRSLLPVIALVLWVALPGPAAAQASSTFQELPRILRPGDRIWVVDAAGREFHGRLERLTPAEMVVRVSGGPGQPALRRFARPDIQRITRRGDSLTNGVLIGFGAGAGFGCATAAGFSGETRAGDCVAGALMFGAMGLALGLGLDALTVAAPVLVYERPEAVVSLAPLVRPHVVGARITFDW
jgi:hypothetical protein